jgi:hypothetical protein
LSADLVCKNRRFIPHQTLPESFENEAALNEFMSRPTPDLVGALGQLKGDLVLLGIGVKMGVTMGMLAARALRETGSKARVIGVSRFSDADAQNTLEQTISCDLLDPDAVMKLPDASDVIYLAGRKLGTSDGGESLTWAMNALAPAHTARRYPSARIVVLSTGYVYPMVESDVGGCDEAVHLAPLGEYAMSALARERILEYASHTAKPHVCLVRLNYALELRYGVIHDIAQVATDLGNLRSRSPLPARLPHSNGLTMQVGHSACSAIRRWCQQPSPVGPASG